ncbi:MAG: RNA 2',3'-cyclic phosphodiesterase [Syntrophales bacterium]|nr:RNA 2',3'-cyclic phosphodiesterase [Syntrophales bacterium]MCK9528147.1 RNA 2',3'-cyclic phosphodiesterase [Syntrophales bacterium]MDX9921117.1 RNA 2',3'-cyclic phosphodiesterase [Syntrophales bacterium]
MNRQSMRMFIAVELPGPVVDYLEMVQNRLKGRLGGVRWVAPSSIHLTLKFLGDTDSGLLEILSRAVRKHTDSQKTITLSLAEVGVFPDVTRPRTIWVGLGGDTAVLSGLRKRIESELDALGCRKEKRSFKPHVTLGRVTSVMEAVPGLKEAMDLQKTGEEPSFTVRGLTLFRSDLHPRGARYTPLERYPFGDEI